MGERAFTEAAGGDDLQTMERELRTLFGRVRWASQPVV